jgi:hypothetical protein
MTPRYILRYRIKASFGGWQRYRDLETAREELRKTRVTSPLAGKATWWLEERGDDGEWRRIPDDDTI